MRIFKNRYFKRILSILILCTLVLCMDRGLGMLLEPVTNGTFLGHDMQKIEKEDYHSVVVFFGGSRTDRTFVPQVLEDKWGVDCVINAGTASQPISGTYYYLKDMIERVHPDKVYISASIDQLVMDDSNLQKRMLVYDRLSAKNKVAMALNCMKIDEALYLLDTYRYRDRFDYETIRSTMERRKKLEEADYYADSKDRDHDTGFIYSNDSCASGTIPIKGHSDFSEDLIISENLRYLDRCIELCRENKIDVDLVTGVTSVMRMYNNDDYQKAVDFYSDYASQKGIRYYNLNYLKGREQTVPDERMMDYNHLNGEGANIVSSIFADIVVQEEAGEDISGYFYKDIDEFKKDVKRIVAVEANIEEDEESPNLLHIHLNSLQNDDVKPIYRVLVRYADDDFRVISDWTGEADVDIQAAADSDYVIRVEADAEKGDYGMASHEYKF